MKTRLQLLTAFFIVLYSQCTCAQVCNISLREADKPFPDIKNNFVEAYEITLEYKIGGRAQFDTVKEYYDNSQWRGRVDLHSGGKTTTHYYYNATNEGFNVEGRTCESMTAKGIPSFMKDLMTEWLYEKTGRPIIHGPSAMLYYGLESWINDSPARENTGYMGIYKEERIRGIITQYWRRCVGNFTFDYHFTTDTYDDPFGVSLSKIKPIRIQITKDSDDKDYPQIYDFVTFRPYITDLTKLQVPTGVGCRRGDGADKPKMPDFSDKNLLIFGEAVYKDLTDDSVYDYSSTFMVAMDVRTDHLAYSYTPWGNATKSKPRETAGIYHMIYDMKNKYLYKNDIFNGNCTIFRQPRFLPKYVLPDKSGYVDLTDAAILFPNNEFSYISHGIDRNMDVFSFEAVFENYNLGNRTVPKAIITRNYLKDSIEDENTVGIKNPLTSIRMELLDKENKVVNELIFNFFGFTTTIDFENVIFDVRPCFKGADDSLWVTIGYAADSLTFDMINSSLPSIETEFRETIETETELNALRMPSLLIDFGNMLYISFIVLDKPSVLLDFLDPIEGQTIQTDEVEGIRSDKACAIACLESEDNCWGFSICGATCYYGIGEKRTVSSKGCKLYRRFNNESFIPSKENIKSNLKKMVDDKQMKLSIRTSEQEQPIFLDASYIEINSPGETDELFNLIGVETNPRFRVVKVGSKLDPSLGNTVKNFGKLRYDECQRICLDYQACETVSYCLRDSACILSTTYGEEIPQDKIQKDDFCNLLTRKYADQFERTPGLVLSQNAKKITGVRSVEECAKACARETSFQCLSFDNCPASAKDDTCRLHDVHFLDIKTNEKMVSKETTCGHYSRKYSYDYKKESSKRSLDAGTVPITGVTLEMCAKMCSEFGNGICYGYDFCEDKTLTSSTCTLLTKNPSTLKTAYSPICSQFLQKTLKSPAAYTNSTAAWVGILCFVIAVVVGVALTFAIGYWRANRAR